jgi:hypothetical protein
MPKQRERCLIGITPIIITPKLCNERFRSVLEIDHLLKVPTAYLQLAYN